MTRIIVADDNDDLRSLIVERLEAEGFEVHDFDNGRSAFDAIGQIRPDLIVSDIVMDDGEGIELLAAVNESYPELRLIVMSGRERYLAYAKGLGAFATLLKPFRMDVLMQCIDACLASRQ